MPREVAYHLLVAEAAAWPIASDCAFEQRITAIGRAEVGVLDGATKDLAAKLEERLRPRAAGMSLEVLRHLRDGAWFEVGDRRVDVIDHLVRVARQYLAHQGGTVILRPKDANEAVDQAERAGRWRWLSLFLPADLLVAALFAAEERDPTTDQVTLTTHHLRHVLDMPLPTAETHLHVGAAMPFALLWTGLMHSLATADTSLEQLQKLKGVPFKDPVGLLEMLLVAGIARLLLHRFLARRDLAGETFEQFQADPLQRIAGRLLRSAAGPYWYARMRRALARLTDNDVVPVPLAELQLLYRLLASPERLLQPKIADVILADPLAAHVLRDQDRDRMQAGGLVGGVALPETRFTARGIAYLRGAGRADHAFRLLFLQYQRVRGALFRYLIEEPGTAGMDWFSRHYHRVSPLRGPVDRVKYESALRTDAIDLRLGSLEARTAPGGTWQDVRDEVRAFARQASRYEQPTGHARPEIGLILHFIKSAESPADPSRMNGDPRAGGLARYGSWYRAREREALAMIRALQWHPELLAVLRGIDVANLELAVPTWPVLPLLQTVRRESVDVATVLARVRPQWQVPPLRLTVHVGEDFRRLVEGLRHIHEPAEFGLLVAGDRIGHGIALGTDPDQWAARARIVAQPAEERLEDLLWELERYGEGAFPTDAGRVEQVRSEAVRLAREIYRDDQNGHREPSLDLLLEARRLRHDPTYLRAIGYPDIRVPPQGDIPILVHRALTDPGVFSRGQRPIEVLVTPGEVAMLRVAQRWLRRLFGRTEITVETNPSSNQIIGDMVALEEHPAFRMRPLPGRAEPDGGSLHISINTDNPITFASCLADEFAYIYYALLRAGIESHVALEWLEGVRACGWRSRFTLPATTVMDCLQDVGPPEPRLGRRIA